MVKTILLSFYSLRKKNPRVNCRQEREDWKIRPDKPTFLLATFDFNGNKNKLRQLSIQKVRNYGCHRWTRWGSGCGAVSGELEQLFGSAGTQTG
jgi:hypothetical protein